MRSKIRLFSSRRGFLSGLIAAVTAVCLGRPSHAHAVKADVKSLLSQLEFEALKTGRPRRMPHFRCSGSEGKAFLWTESGGIESPMCALNETGRLIWEACDGNHTADEISRSVHDTFLVAHHRARVDVLDFLWSLKVRGAIQ